MNNPLRADRNARAERLVPRRQYLLGMKHRTWTLCAVRLNRVLQGQARSDPLSHDDSMTLMQVRWRPA